MIRNYRFDLRDGPDMKFGVGSLILRGRKWLERRDAMCLSLCVVWIELGGDQSGAHLLSNCCLLSVFCTFDRTTSILVYGEVSTWVMGYSDVASDCCTNCWVT